MTAPPVRPVQALRANARRIAHLAWPVLVGQLAVLAFSTIDTILLARLGAQDLAALAVGSAIYVTVFVGFMGVLLAIGPIVGRLYGSGERAQAGRHVHQGVWLALMLSAIGCLLLLFPQPFLWLAKADPTVAEGIRSYLQALAVALPAALLFTVYRGFNNAVSRPKAVMALQLLGLALKLPLSVTLAWGVPGLGLQGLGVLGCGVATAIVMWSQCLAAWLLLRRDSAYAPYELTGRGLDRPQWAMLKEQLRLGLPMGAGILIEVTGFSFMAIFIARLGELPVAGHQIAANLAALLFMMPLALSNATSTLVAQRLGAQDEADARSLAAHGMLIAAVLALGAGTLVFLMRGSVVGLYTTDAAVAAVALSLIGWLVWFHLADALQTMAALVLRAYHVATVPVVIYALSLWGVGLGGGYALAFRPTGAAGGVDWVRGAPAFWATATISLVLAATALSALLAWVIRQRRREHAAAATAG